MRNAMKMKEEKKRWLHFYNRILSGVLVLLGFNACDGTGADEYGTPYCRFEIKGKWFYVNGRKTMLRGTVENCDFPLTGYAPMDVESWERVFRICRSY